SMRAVAAELGAATMATYNHVKNKDALLHLVHEEVLRRRPPLALGSDGWEESLRRYLRSQLESFRPYPGLAAWVMKQRRFGVTPEVFDMWLTFFTQAGFDERQATL